jgi:hypothetical protein
MSAKSARRKTWTEKLADSKGLPKVGRVAGTMTKKWGTGTMVIPAPLEVDELMRRVPKGRVTTINEIREALARKHGVNFACPITTGELNPKYPGGIAAQARRLRAEGLAIEPGKGKKPPMVKNLTEHLARPVANSKT